MQSVRSIPRMEAMYLKVSIALAARLSNPPRPRSLVYPYFGRCLLQNFCPREVAIVILYRR